MDICEKVAGFDKVIDEIRHDQLTHESRIQMTEKLIEIIQFHANARELVSIHFFSFLHKFKFSIDNGHWIFTQFVQFLKVCQPILGLLQYIVYGLFWIVNNYLVHHTIGVECGMFRIRCEI